MQTILKIAKTLALPEKDISSLREYLEHNEVGIAFELMCSAIEQEEFPVSEQVFRQITDLGTEMEFDKSLWDKIKIKQSGLPLDFHFPDSYLKAMKLSLVNLTPWHIMDNEQILSRFQGLKERYPERVLIPFARRQDNDDIACFELGKGAEVRIIHDFATPGWEQRGTYADFWAWFRAAEEAMIDFD
ncbi:MAG: MafI family immunity protein [Streptococcaceae bacterium]|jgi:hypothetical protein|nr:MafI family immunity protein [Streptococcaceae bacterium]